MDKLRLYTGCYRVLKCSWLPYWCLTPMRRIVRACAKKQLEKYFKQHKLYAYDKTKVQNNLIVSFTSFPRRINYVWMVVETMKRQTVLPEKIILWLSVEQFPNRTVPKSLQDEVDDLFEIRFVEGDLRSHKKYYYASLEYPNSDVFLIDDDILYEPDLLERVWKAHIAHPNHIISNYGFIMQYDADSNLLPYKFWKENYLEMSDPHLFFGSGGGTLIRPSKLYKDLTNITLARDLTPIADDIWLNAMSNLSETPIYMIEHGLFLPIIIEGDERLASLNLGEDQNDRQIIALVKYYRASLGRNLFRH